MQALAAIDLLDPPATLGGWVLLGSILETHVGAFVPQCLQGPSVKVVVETLVFALVSHTLLSNFVELTLCHLTQDGHAPLSLPLIWEIHGDEIEISLDQPLTIQLFHGLNVWKSHRGPLGATFDFFHIDANKFIPACLRPEVPLRLTLPLRYTPVFKDSAVSITAHAAEYARRESSKTLYPMCSMKAAFMAFDFYCPVDMPQRRKRLKANWRIQHRGQPEGTVAVRHLMGEDGCTVEDLVTPEEASEENSDSDGQDVMDCERATPVADGVEERDAVEIWEVLPGGKEIPYVEGPRAAEVLQRSEAEVWEVRRNGFLVPCI